MVWIERNLKDHPIPDSCHGQGHFPLDQFAKSQVQLNIEPVTGMEHAQLVWAMSSSASYPLMVSKIQEMLGLTSSKVRLDL